MDSKLFEVVRQIHASPQQAVLYITGGGLQALTWLMVVPGASKTVLEARVPYGGAKSMSEILDREPATFACAQTAIEMAIAAYRQAARLSAFGTPILGVSCTSALATDRPRKGDHKVFVAVHDGCATQAHSLRLSKGARERVAEDAVASRLLLRALADVCGLKAAAAALDLQLRPSGEAITTADGPTELVQETEQSIGDPLDALHDGAVSCVEFSGGHVICDAPRRDRIYLPGSFNPLHDGHRELLSQACGQLMQQPLDGCFELSIGNPDKGLLPRDVVRRRVQQFVEADLPIVVTQAPLYTDKARLFPGSAFVVGHDTAVRLVMPKYYGDRTRMLLELAALRHQGCSFLVAGRRGEDGHFLTLDDIEIPEELAGEGLFEAIPQEVFQSDLSSTQLRSQGQGLTDS